MSVDVTQHTQPDEAPPSFGRREQLIELGVFLLLIVPSLVLSFFAINQGNVAFTITAVATIWRDLGLVALVAFFLWRNGEFLRDIGWQAEKPWLEIGLGIVAYPFVYFGASLLDQGLRSAGLSGPSTPAPALQPQLNVGELILASVLVIVVAIAEETVFRGYLMLRLGAVTRKLGWALVLSAFIFSLGHGYEGASGAITVGVLGLVFALAYVWRKSLLMPITMHFLQDFLGIVLLPLLLGNQGG